VVLKMSGTTRVYVGRLPSGVRDSDVEKFFKGFGRIREITLKEGYGFIVSISSHIYYLKLDLNCWILCFKSLTSSVIIHFLYSIISKVLT